MLPVREGLNMIVLKSHQEIEKMKVSNRIVAEALTEVKKKVKPGITTLKLDEFIEEFLKDKGAVPAFKGYRDYPNSLCTSVNEQVVHGIPSQYKLKEGDIIGLDVGSLVDGFFGDAALTLSVGNIPKETQKLLDVTEEALYRGIEKAKAGSRLSDISHAIQTHVEDNGFSIVRTFVGHGIGKSLHEDPQIRNFGSPGRGPKLKAGMVLSIEPMVNMGKSDVVILSDNWTAVTVDKSLSAHFEHTVAITENGPEILTKVN